MSDHTRTDLVTLSRHVLAGQRAHKEATGDLTLLLVSIQLGCKFVATCVRKAGIVNLYVVECSHGCLAKIVKHFFPLYLSILNFHTLLKLIEKPPVFHPSFQVPDLLGRPTYKEKLKKS
jgi:hypothetical protein